jgi:hypothetical protein
MLSKPSVQALRLISALAFVLAVVPFARSFLADSVVQRSSTYAAAGQPQIAGRYLMRAFWIDPSAPLVGGEIAFLTGLTNSPQDRAHGLALSLKYLAVNPNDTGAWESVLIAAWRAHDHRLALEAAAHVERLGPTSIAAHNLASTTLAGKWRP